MFEITDELTINLAFVSEVETYLLEEEDSLIPAAQIFMSNGNRYTIKGEDVKTFLNYGIHSTRLFNKLNSKV